MSEQTWWRRTLAAIEREYERRIRRASEISEYGASHASHADHGDHDDHDDGEAAAIVNVPRGTRLPRPAPEPAASSSESAPE